MNRNNNEEINLSVVDVEILKKHKIQYTQIFS